MSIVQKGHTCVKPAAQLVPKGGGGGEGENNPGEGNPGDSLLGRAVALSSEAGILGDTADRR